LLTSSEPSGREPGPDGRLIEIINDLISLTPAMVLLQRDRYPRPWLDDLRALLQHPETEQLRAGIEAVTREKLRDSAAMSEFFERYRRTPPPVLVSISRLAAANAASAPAASFILAVLCLYLLAGQLPSLLRSPRPHWIPWFEVPYACITTALQLDGLWPARRLVQYTYEMIDVTRMILHAEIERELERCRGFARIIEQRIEFAIGNLADDLRESCRPAPENFRAEVGALAWTLGFVPESAMFRAGSAAGDALPSRRFFRQLVRHSLVCIPTDSLVQYLWLELRDRGPFDVRSHPALYAVISRVYDASPLESLMFRMLTFSSDAPAKLYARA
jgi:hypothetical protein